MVQINLCAGHEQRCRCGEQMCGPGLQGKRRDELGDWDGPVCTAVCEQTASL